MATSDTYEAQFRWPHTDANSVIVTGEFDAWTGSHRLTRTANGFEGTVQVPWGRKIAYKYIVDGRWTTTDDQSTELDTIGNLNNIFHAPARPATPKAQPVPTPEPSVTPEKPSQPTYATGTLNGIFNSAKNAAVAMVEAMAPGTTETPQPTPAVGTDSSKEQAWGVAVVVQDHIVNPSTEAAQAVAETVQSKVESVTAPVPNPEAAPAEAAVPTPKEEVNAEAVLPVPVEETSTAPIVPVPVLPLTAAAEAPATNGQAAKPLDTEIVDGAATIETKSELSTHSPAVVPDVQPSTHTPIVNGSVPSAEPASATETGPLATTDVAHDAPSTHSPVVLTTRKYEPLTPAPLADAPTTVESKPPPITNGVNGSSAEKPTQIDLPAPTQPSVLAPGTPAINGKPAETPSATSSPPNSPRKDRKGAFPTFGRHHRQSSSASVSTSGGTPDEHGSVESPSRKGTMKKKRTSSFFGKVKHIFSDDSKKNKDSS